MTLASIRASALRLPGASVIQQWGDMLVFKVGGKMFLVVAFADLLPESASFKAEPDEREELAETDGMRPAPYLARAGWIQVEDLDGVSASRLNELVRKSHALVVAGLSAKKRKELGL